MMLYSYPMSKWTEQEALRLQELYITHEYKDIAEALGRTTNAVRGKCSHLGLRKKTQDWTSSELETLTCWYRGIEYNEDLNLSDLAKTLKRHKTNVSRKARELGLTNQGRKGLKLTKQRNKFNTKEELSKHISERTKAHIKKNGHPRGMKGKKHTENTKAIISRKSREIQKNLSKDKKAEYVLKSLKTREKNGTLYKSKRGSWKAGWFELGGKRYYYRSMWERNYARYLEFLKQRGDILEWTYEPKTFWFESIKRGVRSYLPDFFITNPDGTEEYHEVKGWMDAASKTKIKRMKKYYPEITLIVIDSKQYNKLKKLMNRIIVGWEFDSRGR